MFCTFCGKELKEGAVFCTFCGRRKMENDTDAQVFQNEINQEQETVSSYNSEEQQATENSYNNYGSNIYNENNYQNANNGYNSTVNNNGYTQGFNSGYQNNNLNYGQFNGRYNIPPEQIYKRSILPFKVVSAVLNLISLVLLAMIGLVAVALGEDSFKEYRHSWVNGFSVYGYITVLLGIVLFIFIILGIALPAKAGVAVNLVTTIANTTLLIWGTVLYAFLLSKVNSYINRIGYVYDEDVQAVTIVFMTMGIMGLFFQIISFILSCIGLSKKKNYL